MRHLTTLVAITAAALALGACSRGATNAANSAAARIEPVNSMTPGPDASAIESTYAPAGNAMTSLPPVSTSRNTARPVSNSTMSDTDSPPAPRNTSRGVESNVSGM